MKEESEKDVGEENHGDALDVDGDGVFDDDGEQMPNTESNYDDDDDLCDDGIRGDDDLHDNLHDKGDESGVSIHEQNRAHCNVQCVHTWVSHTLALVQLLGVIKW